MSLRRINLGLDTSGRPLVVDARTLAKLRAAEAALGFAFTIVQGSWSSADASAGTHTGAGAIDLRTWNLPASIPPAEAVRGLRLAGLIAWYRTPAQGFDEHIHAIDYGNPELAPAARTQVAAWEAGRNGLANNGPDDGARVTIPKQPPRKDWLTMATENEVRTIVREEVANLLGLDVYPGSKAKDVSLAEATRRAATAQLVKDQVADVREDVARVLAAVKGTK